MDMYFLASILVLLVFQIFPDTRDENMRRVWKKLQEGYDVAGEKSPIVEGEAQEKAQEQEVEVAAWHASRVAVSAKKHTTQAHINIWDCDGCESLYTYQVVALQ